MHDSVKLNKKMEEKYSPGCLTSTSELAWTSSTDGKKSALLSQFVHCQQIGDYGLMIRACLSWELIPLLLITKA